MANSGCEVLHEDPQRFVGYIIADKNIRNKIYDKDSFEEVARTVFNSDDSLKEIVKSIDKDGLNLSDCLSNVYSSPEIKNIRIGNVKTKRNQVKKKVKKDKPELKGWDLRREIDKRLKSSIRQDKKKIKDTKQVTLEQALKPIKVDDYERKGDIITGYQRAKPVDLSFMETEFISRRLDKPASQVIEEYKSKGIPQGFNVRSKESIRKHYYRLKWKREGKKVFAKGLRK